LLVKLPLKKSIFSAKLTIIVSKNQVSAQTAQHVAKLANIPISEVESQKLAQAFAETLDVVDQLKTADVSQVETTHQVTGFKNVTREDLVNQEASFTQEEALANALASDRGYFVVSQVLQQEDN